MTRAGNRAVYVRLSPAEHAAVTAEAGRLGVTPQTVIRDLIADHLDGPSADQLAACPGQLAIDEGGAW